MAFSYVTPDELIAADGLRMVVVGNFPSPWGEAAKGIFHIKNLDWLATRVDYQHQELKAWSGQRSGPVAVYKNEPPRHAWADILMLAERLSPSPSLLPADPALRAMVFGFSHEICGQGGLGWERRLQMIHAGLNNQGGFQKADAQHLGKKYGHSPQAGENAEGRVTELLEMLSNQLLKQQSAGSQFYFGEALSAVDIYSATAMALFDPLPESVCPMSAHSRKILSNLSPKIKSAFHPILFEHRDLIYKQWLELPLSL
ncbi:MAG: hypothetical protein V3V02_12040 [Rhizobiaceae bacterium]